jgi:A/G-specific adenine glycosylase
MIFDSTHLKRWFLLEKRDLPWRQNNSPYAVWVSEVMLQQTQVSVVIPYFERWMQRYPTIEALANADLDDVIKSWEGLGYYSRARNLHAGACYVCEKHQGILPDKAEELQKIKGLGAYTIGAILSFAFHQKAAAVDGNVMRVLTRYFSIQEDIAKAKTVEYLRKLVLDFLPNEEPWVINEALIELGATICTKKPKCQQCPLKKNCRALLENKVDLLPYKSGKQKIESLYRSVAVICFENYFLIKKEKKGKIMSDLHEFPYFETTPQGCTPKEVQKSIHEVFGIQVDFKETLPKVNHSFTRFNVYLNPHLFKSHSKPIVEDYQWKTVEEMRKLAFSSGHRRILENL